MASPDRGTMRRLLRTMAVIAVVAFIVMSSAGNLAGEDPPLRLGIPAYGYPGLTDLWDRLAELPAASVVILDPANGPGEVIDPAYERALEPVKAAGVHVYGYVDTDYGRRSTEAMLEDVRRHVEWYAVTGIFLDQTPGDLEARITTVIGALEALGLLVAVNPGQPVIDRAWVELADHVVTFEGDMATYERTRMPRWMWDYSTDKFWHLVYGLTDERQVPRTLRRAASEHVGLVYVTDGAMPNPWQQLPAYWPVELGTFPTTSVLSDATPRG
jgi:hypothetical protein